MFMWILNFLVRSSTRTFKHNNKYFLLQQHQRIEDSIGRKPGLYASCAKEDLLGLNVGTSCVTQIGNRNGEAEDENDYLGEVETSLRNVCAPTLRVRQCLRMPFCALKVCSFESLSPSFARISVIFCVWGLECLQWHSLRKQGMPSPTAQNAQLEFLELSNRPESWNVHA